MYNMQNQNQDLLDHRKSKISSKPKGRISNWPGASNGSAGIEGATADGSVGVSGSVIVSAMGVDIGYGSDLFERMLKKERNMEENVLFRVLGTLGVVDVRWSSCCVGSAVTVAFAL